MTDSIPDDAPARPDEVTDLHGDLTDDPDPAAAADVRDEQQIVDLEGGDAAGGDAD